MRRFAFHITLAFFSITPLFVALAQNQSNLQALDAYIRKAMQDWEVPGLAIAIVKDGNIALERGYGVKTLGKSDPVDAHTMFAIASLSKAFTSASLGMLVDQGKMKWDDRVTDHLPYFQLYDPFATREMTVRDLLSHRSGLVTYGGDLIWYGTSYSREEVIRRIRYLKPAHSFRARYGYQNIMVLAAGEIIPSITGRQWDDFVRDSIFIPLGMTETSTSIRSFSSTSNIATPHTHHRGKLVAVPWRNYDNIGAAASVNSNVHDLAKWIRMWLSDDDPPGTRLASDAVRHELWSPHMPTPLSRRTLAENPARHFAITGLGWFVYDYRGRKTVEHGGALDGMISRICLVPEEKLGLVILTNSINRLPPALTLKILDMFLGGPERDWSAERLKAFRDEEHRKAEAEKKAASERIKNTKPSLPLNEYAGLYGGPMYGNVRVDLEGNALVARFLPTSTFIGDLVHWHFDTFQIELRDPNLPKGVVTFHLNATGKISEMVVNIPNPDFDFTELELKRLSEN